MGGGVEANALLMAHWSKETGWGVVGVGGGERWSGKRECFQRWVRSLRQHFCISQQAQGGGGGAGGPTGGRGGKETARNDLRNQSSESARTCA